MLGMLLNSNSDQQSVNQLLINYLTVQRHLSIDVAQRRYGQIHVGITLMIAATKPQIYAPLNLSGIAIKSHELHT